MRMLAIETSCDETAVAILDCAGDEKRATFEIRGDALLSQAKIHQEYGGVVPMLAKREHQKNLPHILKTALTQAEISEEGVEVIAVTAGPGLEPALWVGINFAKALALAWGKPLVAVNHMEGHILAALARCEGKLLEIQGVRLPVVALLISGGHTELVLMREWLKYELVGQTRDDAVGEAFDKVARMLGLPYPGGPEISKLAERHRSARSRLGTGSEGSGEQSGVAIKLPRPMLDSNTCDFSFAGLKTAVLYLLKELPELTEEKKRHIAHEFENAAADVLWAKTKRALAQTGAKTLVIGGGVSANTHIRRVFTENSAREFPEVLLSIPHASLTGDNAVMIGIAGYYHALNKEFADFETLAANGNLSLAQSSTKPRR
ncbi:tRNA (adenosine(37)-N6)-threonylcarbamoyltransferase complex transferase subunit TsaD [Candidatus Kaiserbacteria bacterium]|nr:tRNA (adenosine(37)-N6)-threonylcarbamoyltransferase complex transferase subunit TsaD [Candidatus Kaiserbacteria bacterium]